MDSKWTQILVEMPRSLGCFLHSGKNCISNPHVNTLMLTGHALWCTIHSCCTSCGVGRCDQLTDTWSGIRFDQADLREREKVIVGLVDVKTRWRYSLFLWLGLRGFFFCVCVFFILLIIHNAFRQLRENAGSRLGSLAKVKCKKAEEWSVFFLLFFLVV